MRIELTTYGLWFHRSNQTELLCHKNITIYISYKATGKAHQYTKINTKIQTTSTKCQYQIAASKPTWTLRVKWWKIKRTKHTNKKIVPIITWNPCKPVVIKNTDP